MKKQIPILMSAMMVQAELAGRKSVTRRVVKSELDDRGLRYCNAQTGWEDWHGNPVKCPYGQPGDILYVREDHYRYGKWIKDGTTKKGNQKWKFVATSDQVLYAEAPPATNWKSRQAGEEWVKQGWKESWYKRLARFMPKEAARIWLEVTGIRVERLQDISEEDAIAEGVEPNCPGDTSNCPSTACKEKGCQAAGEYFHYTRDFEDFPAYSARESFQSLWEKINGPESWEANLWVWVVSFKVLSTTGKPALLGKELAG